MIPSPKQTYDAVVVGMKNARRSPSFGEAILMGGKTSGNIGRERWLCDWIGEALQQAGYDARPEAIDRIDIAIMSPRGGALQCVIEAKFLFCHDCIQGGRGHKFFKNVQDDIKKRCRHNVPHLEIVLAANYQTMCSDGKRLGIYHADAISSHLAKHTAGDRADDSSCCGFDRFERDLFEEFGTTCDIFPQRGKYPKKHSWHAEHLGASQSIQAWVLSVRPKTQTAPPPKS